MRGVAAPGAVSLTWRDGNKGGGAGSMGRANKGTALEQGPGAAILILICSPSETTARFLGFQMKCKQTLG